MRKYIVILFILAFTKSFSQTPVATFLNGDLANPTELTEQKTYPSPRSGAAAHVTSDGKMWMFGGRGNDNEGDEEGILNDFWVFDPQEQTWTWKTGSKRVNNFSYNIDNGLNFDGFNDALEIDFHPYDNDFSWDFTILGKTENEGLLAFTASESSGVDRYSITSRIDLNIEGGYLKLQLADGVEAIGTNFITGEWGYHIALTFDIDFSGNLDKAIVYLNGQPELEIIHDFSSAADFISDYMVTSVASTAAGHYEGTIDNFRIWNYALSAQEVTQISFQYDNGEDNANVLAYYNFNQSILFGDNSAIYKVNDVTGNGHDAEIINFDRGQMPKNKITLLVDSVVVAENYDYTFANMNDNQSIKIGAANVDFPVNKPYFKGAIDEFKVFSKVLDPDLFRDFGYIKNLHVIDPQVFQRDLMIHYPMDVGIPNGNNLTVNWLEGSSLYFGNLNLFSKDGTTSNFVPGGEAYYGNAIQKLDNDAANVALHFDGIDDYVDITDFRAYDFRALTEDKGYSVMAWIKAEDDGTIFSITGDPGSLLDQSSQVLYLENGRLSFKVGKDGCVCEVTDDLRDGQWHHISLIVENNNRYSGLQNTNTSNFVFGNTSKVMKPSEYASSWITDDQSIWIYGGWSVENTNGNSEIESSTFDLNQNGVLDRDEEYLVSGNEYGPSSQFLKYNTITDNLTQVNNSLSLRELPVYGTKGLSSPSNTPGARVNSAQWTDLNGNLWLFGGGGMDLNGNMDVKSDLWMFNTETMEWTWVSGGQGIRESANYGVKNVPSVSNIPSGRLGARGLVDANNKFWIFGGMSSITTVFNDERQANDIVREFNSDLWSFDPLTSEWTWEAGSELVNQAGNYGVFNQFSTEGLPGGRRNFEIWFDNDGNLQLFGGEGLDEFGNDMTELNDLWTLNLQTKQWAWVGGLRFGANTGQYLRKGLENSDSFPGSKGGYAKWRTQNGVYIYGGYKYTQSTTGLYNDFWKLNLNNNYWTWLEGSDQTNFDSEAGFYGIVNSGVNLTPGYRTGSLSWVDKEGVFWLYGGAPAQTSEYGVYADFWKYDERTASWTKKLGPSYTALFDDANTNFGTKGLPNSTNYPPGRWHSGGWKDNDGNFWFFGGMHAGLRDQFGQLLTADLAWSNDMWKFDIQNEVFTWMSGTKEVNQSGSNGVRGVPSAANYPSARSAFSSMQDKDGNFWLWGGYENFEFLNDLWKFNPNTVEWTWVSGALSQGLPGIYKEKGVPSADSEPGSGRYGASWITSDNTIYMFGGQRIDAEGTLGYMNDLWKYDIEADKWTWISGSKTVADAINSVYGELAVPSPDNVPNGRGMVEYWIDDSDNLWISGGRFDALDGSGLYLLADIWKFDIKLNMWIWMGGSKETNYDALSVVGEVGERDPNNLKGVRFRSAFAKGNNNDIYSYGGRGINSSGLYTSLSELWKLEFLPAVPTISSPNDIQQHSFTFNITEAWSDQYNIELSNDASFNVASDNWLINEEIGLVNSLTPGTNYYYRAAAVNQVGQGSFNTPLNVLTLPATPILNDAEVASQTSIRLSWDDVPGIKDSYLVEVSANDDFLNPINVEYAEGKQISSTLNSDLIENLESGSVYYARVRSVNTSGTSPFSETIEFLTVPEVPKLPEASIEEITSGGATLNWLRVPEILNGYYLYVSESIDFADTIPEFNGLIIDKILTSFELDGLNPGTQYYVNLRSYNSAGSSNASETISLLTIPDPPIFKKAKSISLITQTSVNLSWNAPFVLPDNYLMEISTDNTFVDADQLIVGYSPKEIASNLLQESVSGLNSGTRYFVRMRSKNASGESLNSTPITFITIPQSPEIAPASNISSISALLTWSSPSGASEYYLSVASSSDFIDGTELFINKVLNNTIENLSGLESGTRYYVKIESGNVSGKSGALEVPDIAFYDFVTVPDIPNITVQGQISQTEVALSWDAVRGAEGYLMDVSQDGFQTFYVGYRSKQLLLNSETISGLNAGEEYQIRLRSANESGITINSEVLHVLMAPETPVARGATTIGVRSFDANWDDSEGANRYRLEVSEDEFATVFFDEFYDNNNPVTIPNLVSGGVYQYRVTAYNQSGMSELSNVVNVETAKPASPLTFSSVTYDTQFPDGTGSLDVVVIVSGGIGDYVLTLNRKGILSDGWQETVELTSGIKGNYRFTMNDFNLDKLGVDFEFELKDDLDEPVYSKNHRILRSFDDTTSDDLPFEDFGGTAESWTLFSIPFLLEDNLIETIFNEVTTRRYKKDWRLVHYVSQGGTGSYVDFGEGINRIELGKSYWFNTLEQAEVFMGPGQVNDEIPFDLPLEAGWNQIGNPYNVNLSWSKILEQNSDVLGVGQLEIADGSNTSPGDVLEVFKGGFVFSDEKTTIRIDPRISQDGGRFESDTLVPFTEHNPDGDKWFIPISASSGDKEWVIGGFGMHPDASDSKDRYDKMLVPRFFRYTDMHSKDDQYFYPYFNYDVKNSANEQKWDFTIQSNETESINLRWDRSLIEEYKADIYIYDKITGKLINMKETGEAGFGVGEEGRSIEIIYDRLNSGIIPADFILGNAYPNPASNQVNIPVNLPSKSENVTLEIYDIFGKKVKEFNANQLMPGYHEFIWNTKDVIRGMYLYRVRQGSNINVSNQKKIILK